MFYFRRFFNKVITLGNSIIIAGGVVDRATTVNHTDENAKPGNVITP